MRPVCSRMRLCREGSPLPKENLLIERSEFLIEKSSRFFNWLAAGAVALMMMLTCADVFLRYLRRPIPGTYEMVGLLGAVFVSFSLAQTSVEKGHIAVDFLVQKLSPRTQTVIECVNALISTGLFAMVSWQSALYAGSLRTLKEVSLTLQMPIYPFVYGISIGCGMLCLVLLMRFLATATELAGRSGE